VRKSTIYIPINCNFYDILLANATARKKIPIAYLSEDKEIVETVAIITDVFTKQKAEFMQLDTGAIVRLDYIVSVNGFTLPKNASCTINTKNIHLFILINKNYVV